MGIIKYMHVEKLGHRNVRDICEGLVTVYPKLDGTNASVWWDEGEIQAGSRNRQLTLEQDNAGFLAWCREHEGLKEFLGVNAECGYDYRLYGEWLVPHTLRTYREEAWRRFWVFDVYSNDVLHPAEDFADVFDPLGIDYIAPIASIEHPDEDQLVHIMNSTNTFLIQDAKGMGEGIVLKRYGSWRDPFGRQTWAKMVRNDFKEANRKEFGLRTTKGADQVEYDIVEEFVTETLVHKELAKLVNEHINFKAMEASGINHLVMAKETMITHRGKIIPRLLGTVFHCLISEEMWAILKRHKRATIDFGKLERLAIVRTKEHAPELF